MTMQCEFGKCLHCGAEVASVCGECGSKKPNDQYTEVMVNLSNGSQMALAVCVGCTGKIYEADKKEVMAAVRVGWAKEHDQLGWTPEQRDAYWKTHGEGVLEIVD